MEKIEKALRPKFDLIDQLERDLRSIIGEARFLHELENNPSTYYKNIPYYEYQKHLINKTVDYKKSVEEFNKKVESLKIK